MSTWYGLWHGGSGYAPSDPTLDIERFDSLQHAQDALYDRCRSGGSYPEHFAFINREPETVLTPGVAEEQTEILLFGFPDCAEAYPDRRVFFGPRGGVRSERC